MRAAEPAVAVGGAGPCRPIRPYGFNPIFRLCAKGLPRAETLLQTGLHHVGALDNGGNSALPPPLLSSAGVNDAAPALTPETGHPRPHHLCLQRTPHGERRSPPHRSEAGQHRSSRWKGSGVTWTLPEPMLSTPVPGPEPRPGWAAELASAAAQGLDLLLSRADGPGQDASRPLSGCWPAPWLGSVVLRGAYMITTIPARQTKVPYLQSQLGPVPAPVSPRLLLLATLDDLLPAVEDVSPSGSRRQAPEPSGLPEPDADSAPVQRSTAPAARLASSAADSAVRSGRRYLTGCLRVRRGVVSGR